MFISSISQAKNLTIDSNAQAARSNGSLQGMVLGETLEATVLEKLAGNKYVLAWKNIQATASSKIPLKTGERFLVKVESLQPQIVLNIVGNQNIDVQINEKLQQWRMNPESLLQIIEKFPEFTKLFQSGEAAHIIPGTDMENLMNLFNEVIFSSHTKNNPLFLKEFVQRIGLIPENTLKQLVNQMVKEQIAKPQENLIVMLKKISLSINAALQGKPEPNEEIMTKLVKMASFTDDALKVLEMNQVINSVCQERNNGLMLQIPIALADGVRLADIYITPDGKNDKDEKKFSSCSVAIFLDLDFLGKIEVKANFREGGVNCLIKCEQEETNELINAALDHLKTSLVNTGYQVGYIDCVQEEGLTQKKEEFLLGQSFFADHLINFFI